MNEELEILKAIYSNEILWDNVLERITYNAFDQNQQIIGFSVHVYTNKTIQIESNLLTKDELQQLRAQTLTTTTTLYELFSMLKNVYDDLIMKRSKEIQRFEECLLTILMKIDHMRSVNVYMKHLKQWTKELKLTGRVWMISSYGIYLLIEGDEENVKKFIKKLKTETVDIDSRGRPCKERLLTQLIEFKNQLSKFDNFDKIDFQQYEDFLIYIKKYQYENLLEFITHS